MRGRCPDDSQPTVDQWHNHVTLSLLTSIPSQCPLFFFFNFRSTVRVHETLSADRLLPLGPLFFLFAILFPFRSPRSLSELTHTHTPSSSFSFPFFFPFSVFPFSEYFFLFLSKSPFFPFPPSLPLSFVLSLSWSHLPNQSVPPPIPSHLPSPRGCKVKDPARSFFFFLPFLSYFWLSLVRSFAHHHHHHHLVPFFTLPFLSFLPSFLPPFLSPETEPPFLFSISIHPVSYYRLSFIVIYYIIILLYY